MPEYKSEFLIDDSGNFKSFSGNGHPLFQNGTVGLMGTNGCQSFGPRLYRFFSEIHWISSTVREPWCHRDYLIDEDNCPYTLSAEVTPIFFRGNYFGISGVVHIKRAALSSKSDNHVLDQYRKLLDTTRVISWQVCVETGTHVFVSQQAEDILGYPIGDWYQSNFWKTHLHPEDRHETVTQYLKALADQTVVELEYRMISASGSVVWFRDIINPGLSERDGPFIRGALIDITREKQTEVALRNATEMLRKADEAKTHFLAYFSHEIRSPLNVILGFSEVLTDRESSDHERELASRAVTNAGASLVKLMEEVMDLSKIDSGSFLVNHHACAVDELCPVALEAIRLKAAKKSIQVRYQRDSDIPEVIMADQMRVIQILINLLENSIKYTDQGYVELSVRSALPDKIAFVVEDSGRGIPENMLMNIFEPFVQVQNGHSPGSSGIGLGLSICKRLVEQMNGSITVRNRPGGGAVFTVFLPVQTPEYVS